MTIRPLALIVALAACTLAASAQTDATKPETAKASSVNDAGKRYQACEVGPYSTRFFSLANVSQQTESLDVLTALRNVLCPADKVYLVGTQNIIVIQANADELALGQRVIAELDHPRSSYRLTYTINEMDNGKLIGSQHYALVAVTGQLTTLKQGSKIPVVTGAYSSDASHAAAGVQTQFQYLDVGMNFAITLDELTSGVRLRSKIEQSSLADDKVIADIREPVVRQAVLEGAAFLVPGKSVTLGSIDITGTTRRLDIDVIMEPIH